ncbi:MAG: DUF1800 domain-containing protein [Bacteroidetes bacterium]|nr:DUF1800 domain-containing protein [Bacteroidota bacterium]
MDRRNFFKFSAPSSVTSPPVSPALTPLKISAGLEPHNAPLDQSSAAHLLRRTSFGAAPEQIEGYLGQTAADVAADLVQAAVEAPMPDPPEWINETAPGRDASQEQRQAYRKLNQERLHGWVANWFERMTQYGLREKMTLFWHNHFVTEVQTYRGAPLAYRYVTALRTHALGNFKDFVRAIGLDIAMLVYLNGRENEAGAPNENYGRELLELFTMGQFDGQGNENYTQEDIEEIARALTGWRINERNYTVFLVPNRHDDGEKTFFGRTGAWGYDDLIDLLFEERGDQIAEFIARKLYGEFIYAAPDETLVAELAQIFLDNDFEIAPVVNALLGSAHFFDDQVIGAHIKSPVEMLVALILELDIVPGTEIFHFLNRVSEPLQQALLSPPNVAGWEGHHTWLNTTTFVSRWDRVTEILHILGRTDRLNLVALAEKLHDPNDPNAAFTLPVALAEHLLAVPLDLLDLHVSEEPFAGDLISNPIPTEVENGPAYARNLAKLFLADTPWYEWSLQTGGASRVISSYIQLLNFLPEFQLA